MIKTWTYKCRSQIKLQWLPPSSSQCFVYSFGPNNESNSEGSLGFTL